MADQIEVQTDDTKAAAGAEKAYAAASETAKVAAADKGDAKAEAKPAAKIDRALAEASKAAKPVAKKAAKKVAAVKTAKPVKAAAKKATALKAAVKNAPAKVAKVSKQAVAKPAAKQSTVNKLKDSIMAKTTNVTDDFTAKMKDAVNDAQDRAKTVYAKSQAVFGDYGDFTKGNLEAVVEAGKVLASGLQDMGKVYVAEAKSAFATVQGDVKEMAAIKSPTDFFKLQGEILRRNFDAAVATGSKNSEMVVKLANDVFAPLSTRVSIAVEKVKKAA